LLGYGQAGTEARRTEAISPVAGLAMALVVTGLMVLAVAVKLDSPGRCSSLGSPSLSCELGRCWT